MSGKQGTAMPTGFYPFWFWNGEMEEDEIRWQIAQFAEKGLKGFYIHPRQGLKRPYLASSFMDAVELAVAEAEKHGLTAHLYDEYPYPSGIAGGEVVCGNPAYLATHLSHQCADISGGHVRLDLPEGKVLSCKAFPVRDGEVCWHEGRDLRDDVGLLMLNESYVYASNNLTMYNAKRYFTSDPAPVLDTTLPEGQYRLTATVQQIVEDHKYWGYFADVLNPAAVREYINLTHERYLARFGDKFGISIPSIFTDETHPVWSTLVPERFRQELGYDLMDNLPALADESHPDNLRVSADLQWLMYRMFCEAFEEQISEWCKAHNIRYAGEKEFKRFSQLRYMDVPGCDPGHIKAGARPDYRKARLRSNARAIASAAYFYGKEATLCESYHSMGWGATLQDAKLIAEGLMQMGITCLVPHGFFYTTHALAKHDAPPSFFFQMPYWQQFRLLSDRVEKIGNIFSDTYIEARIMVYDSASGKPTPAQQDTYEKLLEGLAGAHREFMIVDTDVLQESEVHNGKICNRDIEADMLVLPPMRVIEPELAGWLDKFRAAGGRVVEVGEGKLAEAIKEITAQVPAGLEFEIISGDASALWSVCRRGTSGRVWFFLNTGGGECEMKITESANIREEVLSDTQPARLTRDGDALLRKVMPFESFMLVEAEDVGASLGVTEPLDICVADNVDNRLLTANCLRMYDWNLSLLDKNGDAYAQGMVGAVPIANQLADGGHRFAPQLNTGFGSMPEWQHPQLFLRYEFTMNNSYDGQVFLVMEPGSLVGEWKLQVNGSRAYGYEDFAPVEHHVRGSLGLDISESLVRGSNTFTIDLKTDKRDGGLLNALYLYGDFGVSADGKHICPPVSSGGFHDWSGNLLPHFSGALEYEFTADISALPGGDYCPVRLDFPVPFEDACEVSFNGNGFHAMPWSPYLANIPAGELQQGENRVVLRILTSLLQAFEGKTWDIANHREIDLANSIA